MQEVPEVVTEQQLKQWAILRDFFLEWKITREEYRAKKDKLWVQ